MFIQTYKSVEIMRIKLCGYNYDKTAEDIIGSYKRVEQIVNVKKKCKNMEKKIEVWSEFMPPYVIL